MRTSFRLGILAAALLVPSIAAADDSGWYVGLDLGRTHATTIPSDRAFTAEGTTASFFGPGTTLMTSTTSSTSSSQLEVGYWFNSYVGLQAGFLDLGRYSDDIHLHVPHSLCVNCVCDFDLIDDRNVKASGETLAVTGRWPLSDEFGLLGRAGVFASHTNLNEIQTSNIVPTPLEAHQTQDNRASDFGVGVGWKFASHWSAGLWWDQYAGLGGGDFGKFNVRVFSLGIQYHF